MSTSLSSVDQIDPDFSIGESRTIRVSDLISLRVYRDARPRNLKIANLQKGLILVYEGNELVGEGTGFGLPVLVCSDQTYFSGSSTIRVSQQDDRWSIRKDHEGSVQSIQLDPSSETLHHSCMHANNFPNTS